jgi:hypothetical protein
LKPEQRITTKLPLDELWDESGTLTDGRIRNLDQNNLAELVRAGSIQFVVADVGRKLNWIPTQDRFDFWKTVRPQIVDSPGPIYLEQFPDQTAYTASEWPRRSGECLILLEKQH